MDTDKEIVLTNHVRERIMERGINPDTILKAKFIRQADGTSRGTYQRNIFIAREEKSVRLILTAYKKKLSLEALINNIPPGGNGFWKDESKKTFIHIAYTLLDKGLTEEEIVEYLSNLYIAVTHEYGE